MKSYSQKIYFTLTFDISARDAEEANSKLQEMIDDVEFGSDVRCEGFYNFEDEEPEEEPIEDEEEQETEE